MKYKYLMTKYELLGKPSCINRPAGGKALGLPEKTAFIQRHFKDLSSER